ncbi:MAG: class I SAM-dependent methyltransferase [Synechococcus sp. YX04-3]|nr:MAG: class I SAM-dependent methyltransferase [Synechococcus sp. YX04-3]
MFLDIPPVSYYKNVIRSVSVSAEMLTYRRKQFISISSLFEKPSSQVKVLEIGAGNGQYSKILSEIFPCCYATEPNSYDDSEFDFTFIDTHPDDENFEQIVKPFGYFDLICCFSYLEHLPNPINTLHKIHSLLASDGFALLEVPNCDFIRRNGLLSEIIPDHLHYFTTSSLFSLASSANLNLHSLNSTWSNYILSCIFQKSEHSSLVLSRFSSCHDMLMSQIKSLVSDLPIDKRIAVWGAGHQALFILASSALAERVDVVIDSSTMKQHKYIPGINIKISPPSILFAANISLIFVICAGYNSEVISSIKGMNLSGSIKVFSVLNNQLNEEFL